MRTETEVLSPTAPEPGQRGAMAGPQPLALLLTLLTLCLTAGTPEVWVQIQMESTKVPSFTVRCGFLGSGSISLVTVSWGGPDVAGGTRLAVLHPDLGTQQWAPAHQAHWEARTNISLTLGGSEGKSPSPNSTFCCKFVSFPEGSQEACGNLLLSTDQGQSLGFRRPTPAPGHKCELRPLARPPGPPSIFPTPPSTLTTSAQQPWRWPTTSSNSPGGHCSPPPRHPSPRHRPLGHPCLPLPTAVSSLLRMDSMLRQERGLLTLAQVAPASSFSLTLRSTSHGGMLSSMSEAPSPPGLPCLPGLWNLPSGGSLCSWAPTIFAHHVLFLGLHEVSPHIHNQSPFATDVVSVRTYARVCM
ncbi:transmembrane protein PVRIG isoform X1 [Loxodonta africana]|uniref:transmembrane protein PVRIG isoform X1 n=1 Tax=Loxodonta africana TaxID=9785 RepID=UPI0030CE245E